VSELNISCQIGYFVGVQLGNGSDLHANDSPK
jgi:hypothetical protein